MRSKGYFKELLRIIRKRRSSWLYLLMIVFFLFPFLISYLAGVYVASKDPKLTDDFLIKVREQEPFESFIILLKEGKYFETFLKIFLHNLLVGIINFVLGLTFVLPFLLESFNGILTGFLFGLLFRISSGGVIDYFGFFVVMVLEVVSIILSGSEGVYVGYSFFRPRKVWRTKSRMLSVSKTLRESLIVFSFVVFLLLIAATIEILVIYHQWSTGVQLIPV